MSDAQLRNLERCWKETGLSEDEAAYLIGRVRFGSLLKNQDEAIKLLG